MDATMAAPTRRVDMWYEGTAPQNRWTVAFRWILVIPQVFVLLFLWLAAFVVAFIGWFAALFTGLLPEWAHTFISGVIRWSTRVGAYASLLTDVYPPFSFDDEAYPARPILPPPGPLNRWAVLFRWVLVLPASAFAQIVARGLFIPLAIVAWFIVLITGQMPPQLYWAYAALLRYETRVYGYFLMLTSEYAWGMLGDEVAGLPPAPAAPLPPPPPPPVAGQAFSSAPVPPTATASTPAPDDPAAPTPAPDDATAPTPTPEDATAPAPAPEDPVAGEGSSPSGPPSWPPPVPPPAAPSGMGAMPPPLPWERVIPAAGTTAREPGWGTLVLAGAARGWMIFAIVWGSVLTVAQGPIQAAITRQDHTAQSAAQQFDTASTDLNHVNAAILAAASAARTCTSMDTVRPVQQQAATALTKLADDLRAMNLPDNANRSAGAVESDADQLSAIFTQLGNSSDCAAYHATARSSAFGTILSSYPSDVGQLLSVLHADATS